MIALKVTQPFGDRAVGDIIAAKDDMKAVLSTNPAYVVRVTLSEDEEVAVRQAQADADQSKADAKAKADAAAADAEAAKGAANKPDAGKAVAKT